MTMNDKTNYRMWLAIAAAILAVSAGVIFWYMNPFDSQTISAEEAIKQGCQKVELSGSFDALMVITNRIDGVQAGDSSVTTLRVDGEDYHGVYTFDGESDSGEYMRVDGESYWRDPLGDWTISQAPFAPSFFPQCENLTAFKELGEGETQAGAETDRYSAAEEAYTTTGFGDDGTAEYMKIHEYWIDDDGEIVQHKNELSIKGTVGGVEQIWTSETLYTFTGFNEPNEIMAPKAK